MRLLRFWRNTNVAKTTAGKTASLVQNYLGYEWDESPDNGFRPGGLIHLSSTTLAVQTYLLDYGVNVCAYTATHSLSLYRPGNGALMFGAGTVFWVCGLDSNHDTGVDNTTTTDPNVQQATLNLLPDMGVQPLTIQPVLVAAAKSTDTTPPHSTINLLGTQTQQQTVVITGTATHTGGLVAGVEVSTDEAYAYASSSSFPFNTYNAANYGVDLLFTQGSQNVALRIRTFLSAKKPKGRSFTF
jgi:hypothetical protein